MKKKGRPKKRVTTKRLQTSMKEKGLEVGPLLAWQ